MQAVISSVIILAILQQSGVAHVLYAYPQLMHDKVTSFGSESLFRMTLV
jgi:hypothetical protein